MFLAVADIVKLIAPDAVVTLRRSYNHHPRIRVATVYSMFGVRNSQDALIPFHELSSWLARLVSLVVETGLVWFTYGTGIDRSCIGGGLHCLSLLFLRFLYEYRSVNLVANREDARIGKRFDVIMLTCSGILSTPVWDQ